VPDNSCGPRGVHNQQVPIGQLAVAPGLAEAGCFLGAVNDNTWGIRGAY